MNRLSTKLMTAALTIASLFSVGTVELLAQISATATATKATKTKAPATPPPTAAEITDATAKGMVWVNLNTKVYHKPGVPTYGATKHGQFMTEADAQKAGYKAAQEPVAKAKKAAPASATTPK